jgi:hypothetical protein
VGIVIASQSDGLHASRLAFSGKQVVVENTLFTPHAVDLAVVALDLVFGSAIVLLRWAFKFRAANITDTHNEISVKR